MDLSMLDSSLENLDAVNLSSATEPVFNSSDLWSEISSVYTLLFRDDFEETLKSAAEEARQAASLSGPSLAAVIAAYALAGLAGTFGNALVLTAILCRPAMRRSSHNLLLALLACSDLFLCAVTLPLALWELQAGQSWPPGADGPGWQMLCKVALSAPALPVFVSTFAIASIAVDRYRSVIGGAR